MRDGFGKLLSKKPMDRETLDIMQKIVAEYIPQLIEIVYIYIIYRYIYIYILYFSRYLFFQPISPRPQTSTGVAASAWNLKTSRALRAVIHIFL